MRERQKDKRFFKAIMNFVLIIICIAIIIVAYLSYYCFTNQDIQPKFLADYIEKVDKNHIVNNIFTFFRKTEITENGIHNDENEKIFEWDNYPVVDGAIATENLNLAFKLNFTNKAPSKELSVNHSNAYAAFEKLINKEVDLIIIPKPSYEEIELAKRKKVELNIEKVADDGLVFFVDKTNTVNSLTIDQIQRIYSGEITNWKEVGGADEKIVAYESLPGSYTQNAMEELVMGDNKIINPVVEDVIYKGEYITDVISPYHSSSNAIGYSFSSNVNSIYTNNIKRLKINGIEPNQGTISKGQYPLITSYYIVTRNETSEKSEKLKKYMLSSRGQSIVKEAGYISIN